MYNRLDLKKSAFMMHVALICIVLNLYTTTVKARNWEFQGALQTFSPQNDLWSNQPFGWEIKAIYWWDTDDVEELGMAFSAGTSQWDVANRTLQDTRDISGNGSTLTIEGNVSYMPLGVSVVSRRKLQGYPQAKTTFDLGLYYMVCDSALTGIQTAYVSGTPLGTNRGELACDNGLVGRMTVGLEWTLKRSRYPKRVLLNGGYQFDLQKGDATVNNWVTINQTLALEAFFLQFGLAIPY